MLLPKISSHSPYTCFANQTLDWLPMDTQQLFITHLKSKKDLLLEHGWLDHKVTYKFNQEGFRSDEFSDEEGIVFLGCSHTLGMGIPYECTWPYIVSKTLGKKCHNLAIGGGSNDLAFRMAYNYIPKLKPKLVIFLVTYNMRLELLGKNNQCFQFFGPNSSPFKNDKFYETWLMNEDNLNANLTKNLLAIENICSANNARLLTIDQHKLPTLDMARDLAHRGIKSNFEFAKIVLAESVYDISSAAKRIELAARLVCSRISDTNCI
jgi:hypothetical protein